MQHKTDTHRSVSFGFPARFSASCSCGWHGTKWGSRGAAETDADEHVLAITRAEG